MLKFILFALVIFLGIRLAIRLVVRLLRGGVFRINRQGYNNTGRSSASHSAGDNLDEADYEVIESHLNDSKDNGRSAL